jgi:hypothetical protein
MADFIVRVELFRADGDEYEKLYEKMKVIGFSKTVTFSDGRNYKLPTGTYLGSKQGSAESIRIKISELANPLSVGSASVLVCESKDWSAYLFAE